MHLEEYYALHCASISLVSFLVFLSSPLLFFPDFSLSHLSNTACLPNLHTYMGYVGFTCFLYLTGHFFSDRTVTFL